MLSIIGCFLITRPPSHTHTPDAPYPWRNSSSNNSRSNKQQQQEQQQQQQHEQQQQQRQQQQNQQEQPGQDIVMEKTGRKYNGVRHALSMQNSKFGFVSSLSNFRTMHILKLSEALIGIKAKN